MTKLTEELERIRHSTAHIMADAVQRLFPGTKLGMGPATEEGFYYDFESDRVFVPEDLAKIEEEMRRIIKEKHTFKRTVLSYKEAEKVLKKKRETYKLEILKDHKDDKELSFFTHGEFVDLCKGPHISNTVDAGAFKLISIAGAYWKGSEKNTMLQRIYGTAFQTKDELDSFLKLREEAAKRDHRKLGRELNLFSFNETAGAGLVLYHPKGAMLRQIIIDYITKKHIEKGYKLLSTPHILKSDIWIRSGHYDYYKENMYIFESDDQEYAVKPMNCPGHILVYASTIRSYKDLPLRYFELGNVYRNEKSGVLHGLLRVRGFTQDDAHIFCLADQAESEITGVIDFVKETLNVFGFDTIEVELSTKPEKYIGSDNDWESATKALTNALDSKGIKYETNEGDGAFYGPKIDIKLKDAIGRAWQCATIQCDFALPERFNLTFVDKDGKEKRPVVLHRVVLGSLERFMGALIEHYGGDFPLWLSPVQVMLIPINESHVGFAENLMTTLIKKDLRVEIDSRSEKMQKKIRDAELSKIPYMVVIGDKEIKDGVLSVRTRKGGAVSVMSGDDFVNHLLDEITKKTK